MEEIEGVESLRPLMFSIAYRMLGSAADAEDVVQAAFERYLNYVASGHEVDSPRALLSTITTRVAIDHLRSARVKRETYIGPWLPEPLLTAANPDAADAAATSDSLTMAFLVVLETLSPVERAVFLLREVFAYDYTETAEIVRKSEANCRQLMARARQHVDAGRHRFDVDARQRARYADRFFDAVEHGDLAPFVDLLADDVAFYGDGGGKGKGLLEPVFGHDRVLRVLNAIVLGYKRMGARLQRVEVNAGPGMLAFDADEHLINVLTIELDGDRVCTVRSVINPDKLTHLGYPLSALARRKWA